MGFAPGALCMMPQTIRVYGNMFLGPAGWNMDHDDGSSHYHDYNNLVYLGGFKYRDGVLRNMTGNVMLGGAHPWFQVCGFPQDYFDNNFVAGPRGSICGPKNLGGLHGTVYLQLPSSAEGVVADEEPEGGNMCDQGTVRNITYPELEALIWSQVLRS